MTYDLRELTSTVIADTYGIEITPVFTRPDAKHGDFSTNVALQLSATLGKSPQQIANEIKHVLATRGDFRIEIAGPGFINITLSDQEVFSAALQATTLLKSLEGKTVVAEYSDPNPFKILHAGHLYTSLVGDAIANIQQAAGAHLKRVNFGGDVGLHVAKSMWAILQEIGGEHPDKLHDIPNDQKLAWVSGLYVKGNQAYEEDSQAKQEITDINKRVYKLHENDDHDSDFAKIYWTCRQWSYDGFAELYNTLGMQPFDKYYPESDTAKLLRKVFFISPKVQWSIRVSTKACTPESL
jgi:arginyl-tRNA synthetase